VVVVGGDGGDGGGCAGGDGGAAGDLLVGAVVEEFEAEGVVELLLEPGGGVGQDAGEPGESV
jgi:hypothetical protein